MWAASLVWVLLTAIMLGLGGSGCSSGDTDPTAVSPSETPTPAALARPASTEATPRPALTPVVTPPPVDPTDVAPDVFTAAGRAGLIAAVEVELALLVARDAAGMRASAASHCRETISLERFEDSVAVISYGLPALWRSELVELTPVTQNGRDASFVFTLVHQDDQRIVVSETARELLAQMRWEGGAWRANCSLPLSGLQPPPAEGLPDWVTAPPPVSDDDPPPDLTLPGEIQTLIDYYDQTLELARAGDSAAMFELSSRRCQEVVGIDLIEAAFAEIRSEAPGLLELEVGRLLLLEQRGSQVRFAVSYAYRSDPGREIVPIDVHRPLRLIWEDGGWRDDDCELP